MLRRAFVISSLLGAVSAAAALAFAPDLSRVGRVVSSLAPWRTQGYTSAPSRDVMHRRVPGLIGEEADSLQGKFCRFPAPGESKPDNPSEALPLATELDSSALSLEGQSRSPKAAASEATCTGTTPPPLP